MGTFVWRIIGTGSALLAGVAANKVVEAVWKKAGRDAVIDPRDPRTPWRDAVAFAALTGLAVGAARVVVTRKAAEYYEKSAGHLPPPMQEGDA
ncbi:DUF4235 domain-containing protein [Phycicoccus sp. SLBN-51]|uniref:DUF4235 domain-containing protein n=1 Tax=Phycicoccus sp. SLBN-51 TaxID=2768447 RepID=UPI00114EB869|nr:DUF4235 domain-containing protein [Phycicoccus sp. SLBN-51]TQJ48696.1 uncharacterized protein DUF4235 [Phycicoccus sp. SLBN-51]